MEKVVRTMVMKDFVGGPNDFKRVCDCGDWFTSSAYFASRHEGEWIVGMERVVKNEVGRYE